MTEITNIEDQLADSIIGQSEKLKSFLDDTRGGDKLSSLRIVVEYPR